MKTGLSGSVASRWSLDSGRWCLRESGELQAMVSNASIRVSSRDGSLLGSGEAPTVLPRVVRLSLGVLAIPSSALLAEAGRCSLMSLDDSDEAEPLAACSILGVVFTVDSCWDVVGDVDRRLGVETEELDVGARVR